MLTGCMFHQPDDECISKKFKDIHKTGTFIKTKNVENSPPCMYWVVTYKDSLDNTHTEIWQYWENSWFGSDWRLVIIKDSIFNGRQVNEL